MNELRGDEVIPIGNSVLQRVTVEDIARKWLRDHSMCAIDWEVLEEVMGVYHKHGVKALAFDPKRCTYAFAGSSP